MSYYRELHIFINAQDRNDFGNGWCYSIISRYFQPIIFIFSKIMCGNCGQSFLPNRSHKSGAGIYHFTSSYSKSKEQTLATVVSHKL